MQRKNSSTKNQKITAKFGGSSLANAKCTLKVRDIILADANRKFIVVSAPGKDKHNEIKVTDMLYGVAACISRGIEWKFVWGKVARRYSSIIDDLKLSQKLKKLLQEVEDSIKKNPRKDFVVSRGEYIEAKIMTELLKVSGHRASFVDAVNIIFFDKSGVVSYDKTRKAIKKSCKGSGFFIIPGFYGIDTNRKVKTFSRGGSDVTGAIVAAAMETPVYENWTDVSGFYTADPNKVKTAQQIKNMTYKEAQALSLSGAHILHKKTVIYLLKGKITLVIKNTFRSSHHGTTIGN